MLQSVNEAECLMFVGRPRLPPDRPQLLTGEEVGITEDLEFTSLQSATIDGLNDVKRMQIVVVVKLQYSTKR